MAEVIQPHTEQDPSRQLAIQEEYNGIYLLGQGGETPSSVPLTELRRLFPAAQRLIVGDFEITSETEGIPLVSKSGELIGMRYVDETGIVDRIDHHLKDKRVWKNISATNQAKLYIEMMEEETGEFFSTDDIPVVITHTDADSTLFPNRMRRVQGSEMDEYDTAAIDTDHTGRRNLLGDVLMVVQDRRNIRYSSEIAALVLGEGEAALPQDTREVLEKRRESRDAIRVRKGEFENLGYDVRHLTTSEPVDGEFLPDIFEKKDGVRLVIVSYPLSVKKVRPEYQGTCIAFSEVKTRPGPNFPAEHGISELGLFGGGRWDAWANGRKGGVMNPYGYAHLAADRMRELPGPHPAQLILMRHGETTYTAFKESEEYQEIVQLIKSGDRSFETTQKILAFQAELKNRFPNLQDVPLTEKGREEVRAMALSLKEQLGTLDEIRYLGLRRTSETLETMQEIWPELGECAVVIDPRLEEHTSSLIVDSYGDKRIYDYFHPEEAEIARLKGQAYHRRPGALNLQDMQLEVRPLVQELYTDPYNGKKVLVISSATTLSALMAELESWDPMILSEQDRNNKIPTSEIVVYHSSEDKQRLKRQEISS